ncbi:hypothetical protein HYC85_021680 [Camellia sinensis]|uniref:Uncharacterized protein n=1 Tax=Camellia sinensis TaxID=4442 RepID=A0A7J7GIA6_CAMSI|nr:hypothetical protein HYC85_021680 [Camellia sinensis]
MGAAAVAEANSSAMQFQSFPPPDLLSRTSSQSQDLRLSLQSFQDPILLHQQQQHNTTNSHSIRLNKNKQFSLEPPHSGSMLIPVAGPSTSHRKLADSRECLLGMPAETPPALVVVVDLSSTRRQRRSCCNRCSAKTSFFHRGDPFSPVTPNQFVLGSTRRQFLPPTTTTTIKACPSTHPRSRASDSPRSVDFPGFAFQHEFRVKMRSTTAFPTSRPLLPLIRTIDLSSKTKSISLYQVNLQLIISLFHSIFHV